MLRDGGCRMLGLLLDVFARRLCNVFRHCSVKLNDVYYRNNLPRGFFLAMTAHQSAQAPQDL